MKSSDDTHLENEDSEEKSNEDFKAENISISFKEALISAKKLHHFASLKQTEITQKLGDIYSEIEKN